MSLYSNRVTRFLSVKCPWCCGKKPVVNTPSELVVLRRSWLRRQQGMQCRPMMLVVQDAAKKPFVGLVHQLINIGHVRWTVITARLRLHRRINPATRWRSALVTNPLHADTTTALKTVWRPASFKPWWRRTHTACSVWALSLRTLWMCPY